ncbi:MAG: CDP-diacylglycerol--glycerol-3-phosphate 3-phosphatidyltransferase [bacterium]
MKVWTLPNALTGLRLVLVPIFLWQALKGTTSGSIIALAAFVTASITDSLDGYYARKQGSESDLGRFMDPLADKFLVLSAFYWGASGAGASRVWFSIWLVHVIGIREVVITLLRMVHRGRGRQVVTAWAGKWKTVAQLTTLITVMVLEAAARVMGDLGLPSAWIGATSVYLLIQLLFGAAVVLTIISGVRYFTADSRTLPLSASDTEQG